MKILLIGANGYLGSRLFEDLKQYYTVIPTHHTKPLTDTSVKLDTTEKKSVADVIQSTNPDIVLHAANAANVSWCEQHPLEARTINVTATEHIAEETASAGKLLIYISTQSAAEPASAYGFMKRESEDLITSRHKNYLILRPSLILGLSPNTENDRPFNRILKLLKSRQPGSFDGSWKLQPTYIGHISDVVHETIQRNIRNETIAITVPEYSSRFETARDILKPWGIPVTKTTDLKLAYSDPPADLSTLARLSLPRVTYQDMISKIGNELRPIIDQQVTLT